MTHKSRDCDHASRATRHKRRASLLSKQVVSRVCCKESKPVMRKKYVEKRSNCRQQMESWRHHWTLGRAATTIGQCLEHWVFELNFNEKITVSIILETFR